ncbi:MAG: flavin reductase [Porphyrobacter sp.]|nr:flavin reductase [Porphyrobacter sp.]
MPDPLTPGPAAFRDLMSRFTTGVAVVSVPPGAEPIAAMTINSLVSVSLDPMLVCWSLQNSASRFAVYAEAESFAFSILGEGQQALARRYAARGNSAMDARDFEAGPAGLPVIAGAIAHLACRRFARHAAGDHTLILGKVEALAQGDPQGRPLVFFGGRFGALPSGS